MTAKKEKATKEVADKKEESNFKLDDALSTVNKYLLPGFIEYIKDEKVTSQKQFDKLYNDYKEFR